MHCYICIFLFLDQLLLNLKYLFSTSEGTFIRLNRVITNLLTNIYFANILHSNKATITDNKRSIVNEGLGDISR